MSQGTNPERLSQNNELLITNNEELVNLETLVNTLPQALDTTDATATINDIALDKTAYVNGTKITGQIHTVTPNNWVEFVVDAATVENKPNKFTTKGNGAITFKQPIDEDDILFRLGSEAHVTQSYKDIATAINLQPEQIAVGNTILGIAGTASGLDTSDANAAEDDILIGKTAYVNGQKLEGNLNRITYISNATDEGYVGSAADVEIMNVNDISYFTIGATMYYMTNEEGEESIQLDKGYITPGTVNQIFIAEEESKIADSLGIVPGQIVEGNTILGVQGTATELDVTKTEIWDTTNNNMIVGLDDLVLYKDQGVVGFRVNIPSSITQKEQILISGTGYIELQSFVLGTGCLCTRLSSIEELDSYSASDGEYVVIIDESNTYLGTYYYTANTWSEVVSPTAYDKTLTENEYTEAVNTSEQILGEENI